MCLVTRVVTNLQFSLKENGSLSKDSNVTMEIPVHTTLAYALLELEIKHDGLFGKKSFAFFQINFIYNSSCSHVCVFKAQHVVSSTELCLMSDMCGGFEVDAIECKELVGVSGAPADTSENKHLRQGKLLFFPSAD